MAPCAFGTRRMSGSAVGADHAHASLSITVLHMQWSFLHKTSTCIFALSFPLRPSPTARPEAGTCTALTPSPQLRLKANAASIRFPLMLGKAGMPWKPALKSEAPMKEASRMALALVPKKGPRPKGAGKGNAPAFPSSLSCSPRRLIRPSMLKGLRHLNALPSWPPATRPMRARACHYYHGTFRHFPEYSVWTEYSADYS